MVCRDSAKHSAIRAPTTASEATASRLECRARPRVCHAFVLNAGHRRFEADARAHDLLGPILA
jgi:hypothetical protein